MPASNNVLSTRWRYSWASRSQRWCPQNEVWTIHARCRFLETISLSLLTVFHGLGPREMLFFWLTSLPIQEFGFALHKCVFQGCPGSPLHLATIVSSLHMCLCMVRRSSLNMLCHTLRVASLPFDIMKLGTWQLIYPQKSAMMSALSLNLYPLMVRCSLGLHHTLRMGQDGYCC